MQSGLQDALDDLASSRSSIKQKSDALATLEQLLALSCIPKDSSDDLAGFLALQDTFECNVPSRLLAWISQSITHLESLANKSPVDCESQPEAHILITQLAQGLSIIQGVILNHKPSKRYLGRRYALEILIELLLASRHFPESPNPANAIPPPSPLSSTVLDTMLCVLVDSSEALRSFEENGGVQAVVKILKRAGTPREVRMKCLEFLYFYLLDETSPSPNPTLAPVSTSDVSSSPTAPGMPASLKQAHKSLGLGVPTPRLAKTRSPSSNSSSAGSSSSTTSSRSNLSFSSVSSATTVSTSPSTSPPLLKTPPASPPLLPQGAAPRVPSRLLMLRKEVDYVPLSPKKPHAHSRTRTGSRALSRLGSEGSVGSDDSYIQEARARAAEVFETKRGGQGHARARTTEEKKELLGSMLGNVDALVDGVRKAGVWGLA